MTTIEVAHAGEDPFDGEIETSRAPRGIKAIFAPVRAFAASDARAEGHSRKLMSGFDLMAKDGRVAR
jgi:hypothetical protein